MIRDNSQNEEVYMMFITFVKMTTINKHRLLSQEKIVVTIMDFRQDPEMSRENGYIFSS